MGSGDAGRTRADPAMIAEAAAPGSPGGPPPGRGPWLGPVGVSGGMRHAVAPEAPGSHK
ncbi:MULTISPECIES: hypothetical protein [unclassified Streptomyces]|uniref:hypothetical protein n=1 Tax=unclassified Streptomyces TaxID=2593676 RepID=UPI0013A6A046|nr:MULTISPECIES: hypothetical protein [unclassified Streptomyces]